jgi:hypothetical protein
MPPRAQCLLTQVCGVPVWLSPDVPTDVYNNFETSRYARVIRTKLAEVDGPLERVEVHPGVILILVFRSWSYLPAMPVMCDDKSTIWDRLILGEDIV